MKIEVTDDMVHVASQHFAYGPDKARHVRGVLERVVGLATVTLDKDMIDRGVFEFISTGFGGTPDQANRIQRILEKALFGTATGLTINHTPVIDQDMVERASDAFGGAERALLGDIDNRIRNALVAALHGAGPVTATEIKAPADVPNAPNLQGVLNREVAKRLDALEAWARQAQVIPAAELLERVKRLEGFRHSLTAVCEI